MERDLIFLNRIIFEQSEFEQGLTKINRKQNGIYLTNSLTIVDNVLSVIDIDTKILDKRILEPSCGQGIYILKLLIDIYHKFPDEELISKFIERNLFFIDIQEKMILRAISNIKLLYNMLFESEYCNKFNAITWDFTDNDNESIFLFSKNKVNKPFLSLYDTFDYVIGNPPYVTLYGRRDKKQNEQQRITYLENYRQFPESLKNGKINYVMLFLEHALEFLKENGKLSFVIDIAFFETAYKYTRKYLLENTIIDSLEIGIKDFNVGSGQIIIKLCKNRTTRDNNVKINDHFSGEKYTVSQAKWLQPKDEYKFRLNGCKKSSHIIQKINEKKDLTILQRFPNKNLRTCVMLLDMESKFTFDTPLNFDEDLVYPYYQGSRSLREKFGSFSFSKYFYYNRVLQNKINDELKLKLEKQGIKNKKRIGLGETKIYNFAKVYIRQSAKHIISSIDYNKSAANNSLYVFSLRDNSEHSIQLLEYFCGWINSDLITFYAQQMNIIRYIHGKQPQIKIADLGTIYLPVNYNLQTMISQIVKRIYRDKDQKTQLLIEINKIVFDYYDIRNDERDFIEAKIRDF